jgi:hypothetical protein
LVTLILKKQIKFIYIKKLEIMNAINKHELRNELSNLTKVVKLAYLKKDKTILNNHKFGYLFSDLNVTQFQKMSKVVKLIMNSQIYRCEFYGSQNNEMISFKVNYKKFISKDRKLKFKDYGNVILN